MRKPQVFILDFLILSANVAEVVFHLCHVVFIPLSLNSTAR